MSTSKVYVKDKEVESILVDPLRETADIDTSNNAWGGKGKESKFKVYKMKAAAAVRGQSVGSNPMKVAGGK